LVALPGVGISLADALYESGFYSAEEVAHANIEDLIQIRGIGEEKAAKLLEAAQETQSRNSAQAAEDEAAEMTAEDNAAETPAADEAAANEAAGDETADPEDSPAPAQPEAEPESQDGSQQ
jgi:N utilization substance protein A